MLRALAPLLCLLACAVTAEAQQPFLVDDSEVANYRRWHFETNSEYDVLPRSASPNLRQFNQTIKFSYGLFARMEVGADLPILKIHNAPSSGLGDPFGIGDCDFSVKYRFHDEKSGSKWPAIAGSLNIEAPTGDSKTQLGSGLTDYALNTIFQKTISSRDTLRLNLGVTFAGNTLTGVIGIKARGTVFTGGLALVHQFTQRLDLGIVIYGAYTDADALGRGELQEQVAGNFELRKNLTLDFGFTTGQAAGSPRYGFTLGFTKDF